MRHALWLRSLLFALTIGQSIGFTSYKLPYAGELPTSLSSRYEPFAIRP